MPRPSGIPVVDDAAATVTVTVAEIEKRGRLNILPRWRRRVAWIDASGASDIQALMIFSEPGLICIRSWEPTGPAIEQRFAELSESPDSEALEALRLIQHRYQRLIIPARERPSLGDAALAHLGLPIHREQKSLVYVTVLEDRIEVMSSAYREAKLTEGHPLLDDLP
jgi:hypothetical protein